MSDDIENDVDRAWQAHTPAPPAAVARAMHAALPHHSDLPKRAVLKPVYLHLPALPEMTPQEQLQAIRLVKHALEIFSLHAGLDDARDQPNLQHMHAWREARKANGTHVADYEYMLLKALAKFERKLDSAIAKLEAGKPAAVPLPYTICIPLHKGYHTICTPDVTEKELYELSQFLNVFDSAVQEVQHDQPVPSKYLGALGECVAIFARNISYRQIIEGDVEPSIESCLPSGNSEELRLSRGHVAQLLERAATQSDRGRSS